MRDITALLQPTQSDICEALKALAFLSGSATALYVREGTRDQGGADDRGHITVHSGTDLCDIAGPASTSSQDTVGRSGCARAALDAATAAVATSAPGTGRCSACDTTFYAWPWYSDIAVGATLCTERPGGAGPDPVVAEYAEGAARRLTGRVTPGATLICDSAGRLVAANQAARQLLGLSVEALGPGERLDDQLVSTAMLAETGRAESRRVRVETPTGQRLLARARWRWRQGAPGDIEIQLSEGSDEEERAAIRGRLVAGVRHEIRTPLTVVRGAAETLGEDPDMDPADREHFVAMIGRESLRVATLVEDLLTTARLAATWPIETRPGYDLRHLVSGLVQRFEAHCAARGQKLGASVPADPVVVTCDEALVRQLGDNLLGHVVKLASPDTTHHLSLAIDADASLAVLSVASDSLATTTAGREDLFTSFARSSARGKHSPGVGVGLHLVRAIADAHGWRLVLDDTQKTPALRVELPLEARTSS